MRRIPFPRYLPAVYTVEATLVFSITLILIAGGIMLAFTVFEGDVGAIRTALQNMPEDAGDDAAHIFRLSELARNAIDAVKGGSP